MPNTTHTPVLTEAEKTSLLAEFERPKVVARTPEEIAEKRWRAIDTMASCRLEGADPGDFAKVVRAEEIRGELTREQSSKILGCQIHCKTEPQLWSKTEPLYDLFFIR